MTEFFRMKHWFMIPFLLDQMAYLAMLFIAKDFCLANIMLEKGINILWLCFSKMGEAEGSFGESQFCLPVLGDQSAQSHLVLLGR